MPTSPSTALIATGAVLTALSPVAGAITAGAGCLLELILFYLAGSGGDEL